MIKLNRNELLKIYELIINEEHFFLDAHHKRITFFTGIISTLLGITIYWFGQILSDPSSKGYISLTLLFLPILIIIVSRIAIESIFRFYQRFIESITYRAKIESELGLTQSRNYKYGSRLTWQDFEEYIPPRYLKNRSKSKYFSSEDFINDHLDKGYQKWAIMLFRIFAYISIVLIHLILSFSIWKYLERSCWLIILFFMVILPTVFIIYWTIEKNLKPEELRKSK